MKTYIGLLLLLSLAACKDKGKIPDNFDYGETKNGVYINEYLGFEFKTPPGWDIQTKEEVKGVMEEGQKIIEKNNKDLGREIKAADIRSAALFAAFRYPTDSFTGKFNSSVSIAVENIAQVPSVKNGKDYLQSARKMMERSGIDYTFGEYSKENIGGKEFDVMNVDVVMQNIPLKQKYYVTIVKKFALIMIATFQDESEEAEFNDIVRGLKFM